MTDSKRPSPPDETPSLSHLREELGQLNLQLLALLNQRAHVVQRVLEYKKRHAMELFSPSREQDMLDSLVEANTGPFPDAVIRHLFKEIFRASLHLMEEQEEQSLRVARKTGTPDLVMDVRGRSLGGAPVIIAGPCAVEDELQMETVAAALSRWGVGFLRGGAFKPRTSPYAFQGLGTAGLKILAAVAKRNNLVSVSEVVDTRTVEEVAQHVDILQVGARNMFNYELLKAVAATGKPVLLKRGFSATLSEFIHAAEYIAASGHDRIILCERGIRTFAQETRNTLDISAIPLLKELCRLPVVVDISHAAGRRDILPALARASLAAGAHGVMVEVHPTPLAARSDPHQQLDLTQFEHLLEELRPWIAMPST